MNEFKLKNTDISKLPQLPKFYEKEKKYRKDCKRGVGWVKEKEDFKKHPKRIGEFIVALENK